MPTYDYRCERTGEMFELWQSFSDDALTECPQTHKGEKATCGASVRKVFSKVGIAFKGDGFYKNDHGSSSRPKSESTSESTSGDSTSSSTPAKETASKETASKETKNTDSTKSKDSPKSKDSSSGGRGSSSAD